MHAGKKQTIETLISEEALLLFFSYVLYQQQLQVKLESSSPQKIWETTHYYF
jgi:hypothetical protein